MFDSISNDGVKRPGTREMTAMLAGLMALNAFAIDAMVPALPAIGRSLNVLQENDRQLVVVSYFVGFASTQLFWGPLADRFGRKPVLGLGIILYGIFALLCAFAGSFPLLIAGRVAMGASAAVTRVLVVAMVRDLFEAEAMARVMSLVFMTFMLVPVLAPNIGQAILLVASWRAIFLVLAGYAMTMLAWSWFRLPETLHPEYRRSLAWREMTGAIVQTIRDPLSRGYTLALAATFSALIAYISSIQQIVFDVFGEGRFIGLVFASIAAPMALASWLNSRVVGRFGLRRVGHTAAIVFAFLTSVHALIGLSGTKACQSSSSCRDWRWRALRSLRRTSARWRWSPWRHRGHRLVGPGSCRNARRGGDRVRHRPGIRRNRPALPHRLRGLRAGRRWPSLR